MKIRAITSAGLFAVVMLLYLWFPYNMIRQTERILQKGEVYRFDLQPIDPYDAFRGRYVSLFYGDQQVIAKDSLLRGQTAYIKLEKDSSGYAYFSAAYAATPASEGYLIAEILHAQDSLVTFDLPESMSYYYMNEESAPEVEKLVMRPRLPDDRETVRASVDVRILNGEAVVEELYINEFPVKEYLKRNK